MVTGTWNKINGENQKIGLFGLEKPGNRDFDKHFLYIFSESQRKIDYFRF